MSLGGNGSVGCLSRSLPPAGHTPVAMLRQGSPREIRISKSRSGMSALTTFAYKEARLERRTPQGEKPLHSIDDGVQCSAGPHRCDAFIVVREIVAPDVHWFALRRQQLLRDLALGRRQRGGYRSEALL